MIASFVADVAVSSTAFTKLLEVKVETLRVPVQLNIHKFIFTHINMSS